MTGYPQQREEKFLDSVTFILPLLWGKNGSQERGTEVIRGPKFVAWGGHFSLK